MAVISPLLCALFGVILGGFLYRASYALPRGEYREILSPKCPYCGRALPLKYCIPLVGPILLSFRCPHCGERQGVRTLISEVLFATVTVLLYVVYSFSYLFFVYGTLAAILLVLSLIDLDIREVPHSLLLAVLVLGVLSFVFSFFSFSRTGTVWWEHIVGAFVISLPLFLLMIFTGGVGGGDIKLLFCLGLLLAYKLLLVAFFFGILLAAIVSLILRLAFGKGAKYQLPLVPFLSLGAMIALFVGERLIAALF